MDFSKFTQKAKELSKKGIAGTISAGKKGLKVSKKAKDDTLNFTESTLRKSRSIIRDSESFQKLIEGSREKTFVDKKTGVTKTFTGKSLLFICEENSEFTRMMLFKLPVLFTKSFSQNTHFALLLGDVDGVVLSDYQVTQRPALILFENTKVKKTILGEENIQKVVNSLNLDINKTINEL